MPRTCAWAPAHARLDVRECPRSTRRCARSWTRANARRADPDALARACPRASCRWQGHRVGAGGAPAGALAGCEKEARLRRRAAMLKTAPLPRARAPGRAGALRAHLATRCGRRPAAACLPPARPRGARGARARAGVTVRGGTAARPGRPAIARGGRRASRCSPSRPRRSCRTRSPATGGACDRPTARDHRRTVR